MRTIHCRLLSLLTEMCSALSKYYRCSLRELTWPTILIIDFTTSAGEVHYKRRKRRLRWKCFVRLSMHLVSSSSKVSLLDHYQLAMVKTTRANCIWNIFITGGRLQLFCMFLTLWLYCSETCLWYLQKNTCMC